MNHKDLMEGLEEAFRELERADQGLSDEVCAFIIVLDYLAGRSQGKLD